MSTAQELHERTKEALGALATKLGGSPKLWTSRPLVRLVLRQGARLAVKEPELLAAIGLVAEAFASHDLKGAALDEEVGPYHFRAALIDALRVLKGRRPPPRPPTPTVMECR